MPGAEVSAAIACTSPLSRICIDAIAKLRRLLEVEIRRRLEHLGLQKPEHFTQLVLFSSDVTAARAV